MPGVIAITGWAPGRFWGMFGDWTADDPGVGWTHLHVIYRTDEAKTPSA